MGFYPKHLKVKRHRYNMRIIATAALSGATFVSWEVLNTGRPTLFWRSLFADTAPDAGWYRGKRRAAETYLVWWFDKQGMWPKRRSALKKWGDNYRGGN